MFSVQFSQICIQVYPPSPQCGLNSTNKKVLTKLCMKSENFFPHPELSDSTKKCFYWPQILYIHNFKIHFMYRVSQESSCWNYFNTHIELLIQRILGLVKNTLSSRVSQKKRLFQKNKKRNPPCISLWVSLKRSNGIFDLDHV